MKNNRQGLHKLRWLVSTELDSTCEETKQQATDVKSVCVSCTQKVRGVVITVGKVKGH